MRIALKLVVICLLIAGCGSINPYNVSEGEGAYLKNREEYRGKSRFVLRFHSGLRLNGKEKLFADAINAVNRIPAGEISLGVYIDYYPEGKLKFITLSQFFDSSVSAKDLHYMKNPYDIRIFNHGDVTSDPYFKGISLNAVEGMSYTVNCTVENGRAYIWIEDESANIVTEKRIGKGGAYNDLAIWTTLPDPDK